MAVGNEADDDQRPATRIEMLETGVAERDAKLAERDAKLGELVELVTKLTSQIEKTDEGCDDASRAGG